MIRKLSITKLAIALGIAAGLSAGGATYLKAEGTKQCYHSGSGTCEMCAQTCLGSGYLCCSIVVKF